MIPRDESDTAEDGEASTSLQVVHHSGSNTVTTECAPLLHNLPSQTMEEHTAITSNDIIPV